jgi:hypothetical protein
MGGHPPESEDSGPIDVPRPDADERYAARPPLGEPPDSVEEQSDQSFPASDPPSWSGASI